MNESMQVFYVQNACGSAVEMVSKQLSTPKSTLLGSAGCFRNKSLDLDSLPGKYNWQFCVSSHRAVVRNA